MPSQEFVNALKKAFYAGRQSVGSNNPTSFDTWLENEVNGLVGGQFNLPIEDMKRIATTRQRELINHVADTVSLILSYWPTASGKTTVRRLLAHRILMDDDR